MCIGDLEAQDTLVGGREDTEVVSGYCHLFYLTSSDFEELPFDNVCFVNDITTADSFLVLRFVGPIHQINSLFRSNQWAIHIEMPFLKEIQMQQLKIQGPAEPNEKGNQPPPGIARLFLTDNRIPNPYLQNMDKVNFRGVSGTLRIGLIDATSELYEKKKGLKYEVSMEVFVQKVEEENGATRLTGPRILLKSSFYIIDYLTQSSNRKSE